MTFFNILSNFTFLFIGYNILLQLLSRADDLHLSLVFYTPFEGYVLI